jgi:hypothetical protein
MIKKPSERMKAKWRRQSVQNLSAAGMTTKMIEYFIAGNTENKMRKVGL